MALGLLFIPAVLASGQAWLPLGSGLLGPPNTLYADGTDRLLCGGTFIHATNGDDSVEVMGIAKWDGHRFDSLTYRIQTVYSPDQNVVGPVDAFLRYDDVLYAAGGFGMEFGDTAHYTSLAKLTDGVHWEGIGCETDDGVSQLGGIVDGQLCVTGYWDEVCGLGEVPAFQYDGATTSTIPAVDAILPYSGQYIGHMFSFQGERYITGHIVTDLEEVEFYSLLRFRAGAWQPVPGFETAAPIKCIWVEPDRFYVGGTFRQGPGIPGNSIAAYDGAGWDDLGGGVADDLENPGQGMPVVWDMELHNGQLYAVGEFLFAGADTAVNVAKWNGTTWCGLGEGLDGPVTTAAIWRDSLFIGGPFVHINGQTFNHVAKWTGDIASPDCIDITSMADRQRSCTPALAWAGDELLVSSPCRLATQGTLTLLDLAGRIHAQRPMPAGSETMRLPLAGLPAGLYVITLREGTTVVGTTKVVLP